MDDSQSVIESLPDAPAGAPTKQSYRSFKKKFAKLKVKFELGMRDSESLILEELRIQDLSKRIQEQNEHVSLQLLEALLEFNDSLHITPDLRYDLSAPGDDLSLTAPERELSPSHIDPSEASSMLKKAKSDLTAGRITVEHYRDLEIAIKRNEAFAPRMQFTSLMKIPHTPPQLEEQNQSGHTESGYNLGFFTPEHETEHYLATDARLGDESAALQLNHAPEKPSLSEREREAALRNPISVYNWLRRNQPHIFLQDNENASEKSTSRPSNLRTSKKAASQPRKDEDIHDDDSVLMDTGLGSGGSKGKRKREEDAGYRPKGGSNSRSSRKRKDDGSSNVKRSSKRSSGVGA
ncbi:hypothetical protein BBP40_002364 [Aspergillus hancockii]|nr:hypothetical protein BBP40_002364 [Aspergillus hancockii]